MGNWKEVYLGNEKYVDLIMGQSPPSSTYNTDGIGLPFYQGKKEFGDLFPTPKKYCTKPKKIAEKGDILLSVRAPVGPTNLCSERSCIGRGLAAIRTNQETTNTKFILYYFKNFEEEIETRGQGSTFNSISGKELKKIKIPIPPLEEQNRLVVKLDALFERIDQAIELMEENIQFVEELMGSVLDSYFIKLKEKYDEIPLLKRVKFKGGSQPPKSKFKYELEPGYVRLIQIRDYKSDDHLTYIPKSSTKKFCEPEDVMIGRYGPPVFQILRGLKGAYNVALMKAIPDTNYLSKDYLFYFLQNSEIQNYIISISQRSAGQSGVNKKALEDYNIVLPPIKVQKEVVSQIENTLPKVEQYLKHVKKKLEYLKSLKSSLLDQAFKGELA